MAFLEGQEIWDEYDAACKEALVWREDYAEFERLMNNGLLPDIDETLPEVNDGSLAASLFKLPKRIFNSNMTGRAKSLDVEDSDSSWITELANIVWETKIIKNANTQATFHRKWKDAIRKAAGFGGQPLITLFTERGNYTGSDFIVPIAQDVKLQAGRVSDMDSDAIFWDVFYDRLQLKNIIEQAKEEILDDKAELAAWSARKDAHAAWMGANPDAEEALPFDEEKPEPYNVWDIEMLQEILNTHNEEDRNPNEDSQQKQDKAVKRGGYHFYIAFQRGVDAPFTMNHKEYKDRSARRWTNPDPTGDTPVHYLYCYQDFVNPYGIGIVKLAGGTQNVLDYMRQAHIKAVQISIDPPLDVHGDTDNTDLDSLVNTQRALWFSGDATIKPQTIASDIISQMPDFTAMYKTSLNQILPTGDTSIGSQAGDPNTSKTPAGVKFTGAQLSIDDDDFKDNLYVTYEMKAKSMINTMFANMQGSDLLRLSDEQRDILIKAGLPWPTNQDGQLGNQLNVIWDEARATFDFEVDAEQDKTTDDKARLEGLLTVAKYAAETPDFDASLLKKGKELDRGELYSDVIALTSDNDKIIVDVSPEDKEQMEEQQQQSQESGSEQATPASESLSFKDVAAVAPNAAAAMLEQNGLPGGDLAGRTAGDLAAEQNPQSMQPGAPQGQPTAPGDPTMPADGGQPALPEADPTQQPEGQEQPEAAEPSADGAPAGAQQADPFSSLNYDNDEELQPIMQQYGVDGPTAAAMRAAARNGFTDEEIHAALQRSNGRVAPSAGGDQ